MTKREAKEKRETRSLLIILSLFFLLSSIATASATDVAYIYKASKAVDENIVDVFEDMGLSVERIQENALASTDFSNYKIIFVGDERFRKVNLIPIAEKPTVIANYYHGEIFGLTDYDGVSKLASTAPLSVKQDSQIKQVYTQAKYSNGISIPYYYLDDENKANGMNTVARTYTGNNNGYDFGDVISYANAGTKLVNGKITLGKICFFGIIESDYWTPEAKQMFEDCVGFVGMVCSSDDDCPSSEIGEKYCSNSGVYQDIQEFHCEAPGTVNSQCVENVVSEKVKECGENSTSSWSVNYCKNNTVYKNRTIFEKGCLNAECFSNKFVEEQFVEHCEELCLNGECVDYVCEKNSDCDDGNSYTYDTCINPSTLLAYCKHDIIICLSKNDCGTDGWLNEEICQNEDVYDNYITFTCNNNGTPESFCSNSTELKLKENCSLYCAEGGCVECYQDSHCPADLIGELFCSGNKVYNELTDYSCKNYMCISNSTQILNKTCKTDEICSGGECKEIVCSKNTDCGINGFSGWKYCKNGNSYEDFMSFTCINPGKINSYCTNYTLPILQEYCDFECISGECYTCFNNLSCGTDGFIGNKYCEGNDVYQNYKQFECVNPATPDSDCLSSIFPKLIEECVDVCILGGCVGIECYNDTECNDFNVYTIDRCINPATINSYCSHTPINCINNEDCGTTGFIGDEFCFEDDVFKNYQNSTCVNAGTTESYCDVSLTPEFLIDCGEDEYTDWQFYCAGDNLYKKRNFYDRGCSKLNGKGCFENISLETVFVKECDYGCYLGECLPECETDEDCNDGLFCNGQETCTNESCQDREDVDCNPFNLDSIETCFNIPDNNNLTFDFFGGFISVCDENTNSCTTGFVNLTHTCDFDCGAECSVNSDCPEKCTQTSHKLYNFVGCNSCVCEYSSYECVIGKCGAVCDSNDDCTCQQDYCNGTTLVDYPENSSCGTSGNQGCLCSECIPTYIENSTQCGYVEPYCGDGIVNLLEQCEFPDTNNNSYCSQTTQGCLGNKLGTRDAFGFCDLSCGCAEDDFDYNCVKGECGAECSIDEDCEANSCNATYEDECQGTKLVDYNNNGIFDIFNVYNECDNTCNSENCGCSDCNVDCSAQPVTHCVIGECGAQCVVDSDCDDGNVNTIDSCVVDCCTCIHEPKEPVCGDGHLDIGEECDDGNLMDGDGCSSLCVIEYCGDGTINNIDEECEMDSDCDEGNYCNVCMCYEEPPQKECGDFGFDFFVSKWEYNGNWKLNEEIMPGTSVTGDCDEADWDVGSSVADGIVAKAGQLYEAVNGTSGSIDKIDGHGLSYISFCAYYDEPVCEEDSDCGTDYCTGEPNYCMDGDVYQNITHFICNNPGEYDAYCSSEILPWLIRECRYNCRNGYCVH